jgi:quinol monooxygenase YgiN
MTDLRVVAVLPAKAGSEDIVRNALSALVAPTREEPGCVSYELYESAATPGTFFTVETWKAQSDLDAHMQTPHIAQVIATAGEHLDGPPQIHPLTPLDVG